MKNELKTIAFSGAYSTRNIRPRFMIRGTRVSKKSGLAKIFLELRYTEASSAGTQYFRKRLDTKLKVSKDNWSATKQEVKPKDPNHITINKSLKEYLLKINTFLRDHTDSAYTLPIPSELDTVDRHFNLKKKKTLISFLDDYIAIRKANSVRGTWKEFRTLKGRLERYQQSRNKVLYFEDITFEWAENFKQFAKEIELDPNTCKKTFEALSTFLNNYFDDQHKHNIYLRTDFRSPKFKKVSGTHSSEPSPLYPNELEKLWYFDTNKFKPVKLTDPKTKAVTYITVNSAYRVKQLFLISCFTGMRFSDVLRLTKGSIQNDTIVFRASKTDKKNSKTLFIPLLPPVTEILESIGYDINKIKLTNQAANRALTELLKQAGINSTMKVYEYNMNGERTEKDLPKHDVVSFHSGRDTFITNCLIGNAEIMTVMSWSGHSKFDTFKKYVALSDVYKKIQHKKIETHFAFKELPAVKEVA